MKRISYDGAIYFDTFPDHSGLDPIAEANTNISTVEKLLAISDRLVKNLALQKAIAQQDATISMQIIQAELLR